MAKTLNGDAVMVLIAKTAEENGIEYKAQNIQEVYGKLPSEVQTPAVFNLITMLFNG